MTIKCARSGAENEAAGAKESRVSRVTIRFGAAVVSAGSWALSICNSLYGVRDVCTWLYCIGHGNATRTISNYTVVDGKRSAGRETRQSCRNVDVFCTLSPLPPPPPPPPSTSSLQGRVENSSISSRGYSLADDIRGSRRMEFSSNIMPHKPTGSISPSFHAQNYDHSSPTSGDVYLQKGCLRDNCTFSKS